jgi:hypothetical protein
MPLIRIAGAFALVIAALAPIGASAGGPDTPPSVSPGFGNLMKGFAPSAGPREPDSGGSHQSSANTQETARGHAFGRGMGMGGMVVIEPIRPAPQDTQSAQSTHRVYSRKD